MSENQIEDERKRLNELARAFELKAKQQVNVRNDFRKREIKPLVDRVKDAIKYQMEEEERKEKQRQEEELAKNSSI